MSPLLLALLGPLRALLEGEITEAVTGLLKDGLRLIEDVLTGEAKDAEIFDWLSRYARERGKA